MRVDASYCTDWISFYVPYHAKYVDIGTRNGDGAIDLYAIKSGDQKWRSKVEPYSMGCMINRIWIYFHAPYYAKHVDI